MKMIETIHHDLIENGISLKMPKVVFHSAIDRGEALARNLDLPERYQFVSAEIVNGEVSVIVDTRRIGRTRSPEVRNRKKTEALKSISELEWTAGSMELDDPRLTLVIGHEQRGYGVYGMEASLTWPEVSDGSASLFATRAMRQTARNLRTYSDEMINDMVGANISSEQGMTFETNPAGACSMDTDGIEYHPGKERVTLYAHNLYTRDMQLICLAGIIAVARADTPEIDNPLR